MIYPLFLIEALKEGFIGILLTLDTLIYSLISSSFKVFMAIAGARLLSSDAYFEIANKIYIIVGVLMLFVLSYAILKGIVDPDNATKGEFGPKMIKNVIIAVVGLAISPVIFNLMYQAQGLILEQDVLGKIFFRMDNTEKISTSGTVDVGDNSVNVSTEVNPDEYVKTIGGAVTAVNLWQAFFSPAPDSGKDASEIVASADGYFLSAAGYGALCAGLIVGSAAAAAIPVVGWAVAALGAGAAVISCAASIGNTISGVEASAALNGGDITLQEAYAMASAGEGFGIFTVFLSNYADDGEISYLFGISTIAGAFALYAFVSFSIDMGIRAAKLAYLQIIAPIPLVMQVIPKYKKSFDNYIGLVVSTFMEVFIRISVVYVVVYIICHLTELFSSASLWANDELNIAERLFALAFLILGLIAFCRKAPEFITNSLGLKKGDMHLGIGKKLAEGGFYAGSSIIGGGVTSGIRNWRKNAKDGVGLGQNALSTLAGFGSGMARATYENFKPGGDHVAKTWRDMKNIAENAAQGANDARDKRDAREKTHADAKEAMAQAHESQRNALRDVIAKEQALQAAQASGNQAAITAAENELNAARAAATAANDRYEEARKKFAETTALGSAINTAGKRIDAWSTGTVSTKDEEAAIKFGDALDALKGKLREEAYKKDNLGAGSAGALKREYERLQSEPIKEYIDGWDEQSYNAEYRRRQALLNSHSSNANIQAGLTRVNDAKTRHEAALQSLNALKAAGIAETDAQFISAKAALDAEKQTLDNEIASLESLVTTTAGVKAKVGVNGKLELDMSDLKIDEATARAERNREIEGLRVAMEAAADAWVHKQASSADMNNTKRDIQLALSEFIPYAKEHASDEIVIDYDANGNPIKKLISDVIKEGFGDKAMTDGTFNADSVFKDQSSFEVKTTSGQTVIYKLVGDDYVPVDNNGARINDPDLEVYSKDSFFEGIRKNIVAGKVEKVSSKSAISRAADAGKNSSTYTKTHDLAEKRLKQRQAEEGKGGKK